MTAAFANGDSPATFLQRAPLRLQARPRVDLHCLPGDHDLLAVPLMLEPVTALPRAGGMLH